nr:CPBP family intramembrane glutamic endopeptidase [uncultured Lichenicoccus sp.]
MTGSSDSFSAEGGLRLRDGTATYIVISFGLAWVAWIGSWIASAEGVSATTLIPLVIAGSFGPFVASGVSTYRAGTLSGTLDFYRRGLEWRMGWAVFLVSLLLLPTLGIGTAALFDLSEHRRLQFLTSWTELPLVFVWLFILGGPLAEEFGWSYLSDRLDLRLSPLFSTLVLGLVWAVWHLPLFFLAIPGLEQKYIPFPVFVFMAVALRFLFSWTYHRGGRSILSNLLIHNGLNLALSLVTIVLPVVKSPQPRLCVLSAAAGVSAVLLWWLIPVDGAQAAGDCQQ